MPSRLVVSDIADAEGENAILEAIKAYNVATFGESDRRELNIVIRNDEGRPTGGLVGFTGRGWLYISMLFVPEEMRGQGLATRLMTMAEDEARSRGCIGCYIDTMSPQALRLYQNLGYRKIGELNHLAGGHVITWLEKRFTPA